MQRSTNKRQREEIIRRQSASGRIVSGRSVSRKQRMKRARRKRRILIAVLCLLILAPVAAAGMFYQFHPVFLKNDVIVQELKEAFHPEKNIRYVLGGSPSQVDVEGKVDTSRVGDYPIKYKFRGQQKKATVEVRDTKAPELVVRSYTTDLAEKLKPEFFVEEVKDASEVSVKFEKEENFTKAGTYDINIQAEDEVGNSTVKTAQVTLKKDESAPQIEGAEDVTILQGKSLDFLAGVTVKDDMDPAPVLDVDYKQVDLNAPGTYTAVYMAKDRSGNENRLERKIVVKKNEEMNQKIVYLTFDDGPSENTGKILDILKEYNVKATFFVTGNNQKYDNLMKRAHDEGHAIGLHTYSHDYKEVYASEKAYFEDLKKISDLVEKVTGEKSYIIRFPGGSSNTVSAEYTKGLMTLLTKKVQEKGYQYFDWNCDSTDASGNNVPVEQLIKNATSCSSQHINILMHDTDAKDTTVKALPKIIKYYREKGYTFKAITVDSYPAHHGVNN